MTAGGAALHDPGLRSRTLMQSEIKNCTTRHLCTFYLVSSSGNVNSQSLEVMSSPAGQTGQCFIIIIFIFCLFFSELKLYLCVQTPQSAINILLSTLISEDILGLQRGSCESHGTTVFSV